MNTKEVTKYKDPVTEEEKKLVEKKIVELNVEKIAKKFAE